MKEEKIIAYYTSAEQWEDNKPRLFVPRPEDIIDDNHFRMGGRIREGKKIILK